MSTAANADSIKDLKDRVENEARRTARTGKRELGKFMDDVEELLASVTHIDNADLARMRGKVEESMSKAREGMSVGVTQLRERAVEAASSADDYARARPWALAGAAALVGLAVGALLTRR
jgi:ElaB/YqjD/DUF883 family membrane-anchored ribosome-binding protein